MPQIWKTAFNAHCICCAFHVKCIRIAFGADGYSFYCSHGSLDFTLACIQNATNRYKAEDGGALCSAFNVGKTILIKHPFAAGAARS
jgi:hypothetical protein